MKLVIGLAIFAWFALGLAGAWMLEGNDMRLGTIALGPISLVKAINETPPTDFGIY